jgi:hypothetical protein
MYDNKTKQNNQTRSKQISNPAGATSTPHAAGHIARSIAKYLRPQGFVVYFFVLGFSAPRPSTQRISAPGGASLPRSSPRPFPNQDAYFEDLMT